jgi:hypothetical protein
MWFLLSVCKTLLSNVEKWVRLVTGLAVKCALLTNINFLTPAGQFCVIF